MANLNQCNFIGNVGRDPEIRYTPDGKAIANFSIAVTEKWKEKERTEWVRCVAFGKLAEIIGQYVKKGSALFLSGRLQTREWQDKDGNKKYTTEIIAAEVQFLSSKERTDGRQENPVPQRGEPSPDSDDLDIPF